MQNNGFYTNKSLNLRGRLFTFDTPKVMGILNVTPDSFYDGGKFNSEKSILDQAQKMIGEGADFIDVGGYSTRPGAAEVSEDEETSRVLPVIKSITKAFPSVFISIDTFRSTVAQKAVDAGAVMINDISGGEQDPRMFELISTLGVPYVLMHMRGTSSSMTKLTDYDDLVKDITDYFHRKIYTLTQLGIKDIIIDPGFGFAKTVDQNFQLLNQLGSFRVLGRPILAGLSRKSMVWRTLGTDPDGALNGTTALHAVALLKGATILRVHDVKEAIQCIRLTEKIGLGLGP